MGAEDSYLGRSVSTAGDVNADGYADIIVGSYNYSGFGPFNQNIGKAEVFHGSSNGPSITSDWVDYGSQAGEQFGYSVACAGDVDGNGFSDVVIGAWKYNNGSTTDVGRAYVFHGSAGGLSETPDWTYEGSQAYEELGCSVDTAGDVNGDLNSDVIIGAQGYDSDDGRILVFHGTPSGLNSTYSWMEEGFDALSEHGIRFGAAVSTAGDVNGDGYADIIVSAHLAGTNQEGKACVFHGSSGGMAFPVEWSDSGGQNYAWYGQSVNCAGDVNGDGYADVIVGAPSYDGVGNNSGQAYVYLGSASGLNTTEYWMQGGEVASDNFGRSVSTAGDVNGDGFSDIIVGADGYGDGGRAYVYLSTANGPSVSDDWEDYGNNNNHLGSALQTAGDVNADGYADVLVGADTFSGGDTAEGVVYLYEGSSTGLSTVAQWTNEGNNAGANMGCSVGTAGDVNGDGYADAIAGAEDFTNGETEEGRAFVFAGSASGLISPAIWTAEANEANAKFGSCVSTAGDVNGDGYADVIVGAHQYDGGTPYDGRAFVYHGNTGGVSAVADTVLMSDQENTAFGYAVSTAGDVNGDGYSDVIVGDRWYVDEAAVVGRVFVYAGSDQGISTSATWTLIAPDPESEAGTFGHVVNTAGDVNGDGYADVIVGAPSYGSGGRVFLYEGSAQGLSTTAVWHADGNQLYAQFGSAVCSAGDVNGDGYSDVAIGADLYDWGQSNDGRAFLYLGSPTGLSLSVDWDADGLETNAYFGRALGTAGDVNGDGFSELLVGAPQADGAGFDRGVARMYYGNSSPGNPLIAQQLQPLAGVAVSPEGISDTVDGFNIQATVNTTPLGRGYFKLEWQVAPVGHSFDESKAVSGESDWFVSLYSGTTATAEIRGLTQVGPHHWRFRLKYPSGSPLGLKHSRWITIPQWGGGIRSCKIGGAELRITQTALSGGTASNEWTSLAGVTYQMQETDSLTTGIWANVGGTVTATDRDCSTTVPANDTRKTFYRIKLDSMGL